MKKIMKAILSLALLFTMMAGQVIGVCASSGTGSDSGSADRSVASASFTYKGQKSGMEFRPGSEYSADDMFNFKNVMPGDELTEEITFTNAAKDSSYVNLYMRAELPAADENAKLSTADASSDEDAVTIRDFLAQLDMTVTNQKDGTVLFEGKASEFADDDKLGENKLLGTFRQGETATLVVTLCVPITMDNTFADCLGKVDWIFHVEAFNESQLSVRKVWSDGNENHKGESVTVNLLKDGKVEKSETLSADNGWTYTFDRLREGYTWTVEEASVPSGYSVSYETVGTQVIITNTRNSKTPDVPKGGDDTPKEPETPAAVKTQTKSVTARKVWSGELLTTHPDSVVVSLYNGEKLCSQVYLNAENNWTYTWDNLDAKGNWLVMEASIPYGYAPSYEWDGKVMTITNTRTQTPSVATLIQTGQLNWPVWVLGGAGVVLIGFGIVMMLRRSGFRRG